MVEVVENQVVDHLLAVRPGGALVKESVDAPASEAAEAAEPAGQAAM